MCIVQESELIILKMWGWMLKKSNLSILATRVARKRLLRGLLKRREVVIITNGNIFKVGGALEVRDIIITFSGSTLRGLHL